MREGHIIMIIVIKKDTTQEAIDHVVAKIKEAGLAVHISKGKERTILGAIGDEAALASIPLETFPGVEKVMPILKPYKLVSREFRKENTVIEVEGVRVGDKEIVVIAGPCSVESRESVTEAAIKVKEAGAK